MMSDEDDINRSGGTEVVRRMDSNFSVDSKDPQCERGLAVPNSVISTRLII